MSEPARSPVQPEPAQRVRLYPFALLALAILILSLDVGGGAPVPSPAGVPDPGELTGWGLSVSKLLADLLGIGVVGLLLTPAMLLPTAGDVLDATARHCVRLAGLSAVGWGVAVLAQYIFSVSDFQAVSVRGLRWDLLRQPLTSGTSFGRAFGVQLVLIVLIAVLSRRVTTLAGATQLLAVALGALVPPIVVGHASTASHPGLAVSSLTLHVVAASLWVGGLVSLCCVVALSPRQGSVAVSRFSTLAGWCFALVLISGVTNAVIRVGSVDQLVDSGYGRLILVKALALLLLGAFGFVHRTRTIPGFVESGEPELSWRRFLTIAGLEVCLMMMTVAVAVALSRTPPPPGLG